MKSGGHVGIMGAGTEAVEKNGLNIEMRGSINTILYLPLNPPTSAYSILGPLLPLNLSLVFVNVTTQIVKSCGGQIRANVLNRLLCSTTYRVYGPGHFTQQLVEQMGLDSESLSERGDYWE